MSCSNNAVGSQVIIPQLIKYRLEHRSNFFTQLRKFIIHEFLLILHRRKSDLIGKLY